MKKIKAKGGDKVLSDTEVRKLMEGLGLSVEIRFNVAKIAKSALQNIFGFEGESGHKVNTETVTNGIVKGDVYTGVGFGAGVFAEGFLGAAKEASAQAHRREEGTEESDGSVTNPLETKMAELEKVSDIADSQDSESGKEEPQKDA